MFMKELVEMFLDGKTSGHRDQIVFNWIYQKYKDKGLSEDAVFKKAMSAVSNFEATQQKILRERARVKL